MVGVGWGGSAERPQPRSSGRSPASVRRAGARQPLSLGGGASGPGGRSLTAGTCQGALPSGSGGHPVVRLCTDGVGAAPAGFSDSVAGVPAPRGSGRCSLGDIGLCWCRSKANVPVPAEPAGRPAIWEYRGILVEFGCRSCGLTPGRARSRDSAQSRLEV